MAEDLKKKIIDSLNNLVTLEIMTAVGEIDFQAKEGADIAYDKDPKVILTRINLLQGDIKTIFDEEFLTGKYQHLINFHASREKEGYEIIQKNIAAIERLLKLITDLIPESPSEG